MTPVSSLVRLAAITALASALQTNMLSAQAPAAAASASLVNVNTIVPAGAIVHVTDTQGHTTKAVLGDVTSDAIELKVDGQTRAIAARHVRRIRWQQRDSWLTGAVIGAGIGASPGIYYLMTDPNECAGLCREEYALIGIGALVGGLIDRALRREVTVYERPSEDGAGGNVVIAPLLTGVRLGVQVAVRF